MNIVPKNHPNSFARPHLLRPHRLLHGLPRHSICFDGRESKTQFPPKFEILRSFATPQLHSPNPSKSSFFLMGFFRLALEKYHSLGKNSQELLNLQKEMKI
ncbi:hypothetical protein ACP275_11G080900 [Erythranthe tilingii]